MLNFKIWINAIRPKTLLLSFSVVLFSHSIAKSDNNFNLMIFILSLSITILLQILSNLANDYGDFLKGTDNKNRVGPTRALQSGEISKNKMFFAICLTSLLSFVIGILLLKYSFDEINFNSIIFFIIGLISISAAIFYTIGKNAYGYSGFGDMAVFIFFGLVGIAGNYFMQTHNINFLIFLPSFSFGIFSVLILNINNMRDIENDKSSNKNTLAVKLGLSNSIKLHNINLVIGISTFFIFMYFKLNNFYSIILIAPLLYIFYSVNLVKLEIKDFNKMLKKIIISIFILSIFGSFLLFYNDRI